MSRRIVLLFASLASAAFGCSSKSAAPPSEGTYTIVFPSTAAAVASDTLQIMVFDVGDGGADTICPDLVIARRSNQGLPPTIVQSSPVSPCDMIAGKGQITVPYGPRAILAIAQRGGSDYLIGCAAQNVGEGSTQVPVQLALASSTIAVPATTCVQLGDHCAGRCPK